MKKELIFFNDLYNQAIQCFAKNNPTEKALDYLTENRITADNYYKLKDILIAENEKEIAEIEQSLSADRAKLRESAATLEILERVAGRTYVQRLIDEEKERRQGQYMNGFKFSDTVSKQPVMQDNNISKQVGVGGVPKR